MPPLGAVLVGDESRQTARNISSHVGRKCAPKSRAILSARRQRGSESKGRRSLLIDSDYRGGDDSRRMMMAMTMRTMCTRIRREYREWECRQMRCLWLRLMDAFLTGLISDGAARPVLSAHSSEGFWEGSLKTGAQCCETVTCTYKQQLRRVLTRV